MSESTFHTHKMFLIICLCILPFLHYSKATLTEMSGFHCKHWSSMRLDRHIHGKPHLTTPPFEFSFIDDKGSAVEYYTPGEIYKVRLVGYIHFRGFMIQTRLCTPEGYTIGSLRGGRFILGSSADIFGVRYQSCDDSQSNDALTHSDSNKKFLVEVQWTAERDVGAVQFMLTIAAEDELYWERWRPRNGFIRPKTEKEGNVMESLFEIEVPPGVEEEATALSLEDSSTSEPFDPKLFEEIEAAEETESNRLKSVESLIALHSPFTPAVPTFRKFPPPISTTTSFPSTSAQESTTPETSTTSTTSAKSTITESPALSTTTTTSTLTATTSETSESTSTTTVNDTDVTEASRRLFKKYSPSKEVELRDDDLRFLNSHVQLLQHDLIDEPMDPEETCRQANPCENGGTCFVKDKEVQCVCAVGFTGVHCAEVDMCINHACANNSTCKNGQRRGTYECECQENTVGTYCQFVCPENQCSGNGTCIMRDDGRVGCKCIDGMTGIRCDKEINECMQGHCQNAVECIDKFNDYECICKEGWIGRNCDRPCQDVYGSCRTWKREGQCEVPRESTDFFELNCPVSCEKCVPLNDTSSEVHIDRLPAVLLPLSWLLGIWQTHVKGFNGKSLDFPLDFDASGYNETITFTVAKPLLFGTPSINFTCVAVNDNDPTDLHMQNGFLTVRQYPPVGEHVLKVAFTTVSNQGASMIEEGPMTMTEGTSGPILNLSPVYLSTQENLEHIISKRMSRSFVKKGSRLIQTVIKETKGRKIKFKKVYDKIREFEFF